MVRTCFEERWIPEFQGGRSKKTEKTTEDMGQVKKEIRGIGLQKEDALN